MTRRRLGFTAATGAVWALVVAAVWFLLDDAIGTAFLLGISPLVVLAGASALDEFVPRTTP